MSKAAELPSLMRKFIDDFGVAGFLNLVVEVLHAKADDTFPSIDIEVAEDIYAPEAEESDNIRDAADEIEAIAGNLA